MELFEVFHTVEKGLKASVYRLCLGVGARCCTGIRVEELMSVN